MLGTVMPMHLRRTFVSCIAAGALAALALTGCGSSSSSSASGDGGCKAVQNGEVTLSAKTTAFSSSCLTMAPGSLDVTFDNEEKGVAHNFHLKDATPKVTDKDRTILKVGPDTQSVAYVDLKPGDYTYVCDIHPNMKGELKVEAASAGSTTVPSSAGGSSGSSASTSAAPTN